MTPLHLFEFGVGLSDTLLRNRAVIDRAYSVTVTFTKPFVQQHWFPGEVSTRPKLSARTRITYSPGCLKVADTLAVPFSCVIGSLERLKTTGPGPECLNHVTFIAGLAIRCLITTGGSSRTLSSVSQTARESGAPTEVFTGSAWIPTGPRPAGPSALKRRSGGTDPMAMGQRSW